MCCVDAERELLRQLLGIRSSRMRPSSVANVRPLHCDPVPLNQFQCHLNKTLHFWERVLATGVDEVACTRLLLLRPPLRQDPHQLPGFGRIRDQEVRQPCNTLSEHRALSEISGGQSRCSQGRVNAIALAPVEDFRRNSDLFGEGVRDPEAQKRFQAAFKRSFQTRDAELDLVRLLGELNCRFVPGRTHLFKLQRTIRTRPPLGLRYPRGLRYSLFFFPMPKWRMAWLASNLKPAPTLHPRQHSPAPRKVAPARATNMMPSAKAAPASPSLPGQRYRHTR
jgi:hypothetical protein